MRTTLDLDDDVLQAARELAQYHRVTTGKMLSDLARKGLAPGKTPRLRNGVPLIRSKPGAPMVTMKRVNELRDDE